MIDHATCRRNLEAFERRHGTECYSNGSFVYYADGAYRTQDPLGMLYEPANDTTPEGEWELAKNKMAFAKLRLQSAVRAFDEMDDQLTTMMPPDADAAIAELDRLRQLVEERRELLNKAEQALDNTRIERNHSAMVRQQQEAKRRFEEFQQRRLAVRI